MLREDSVNQCIQPVTWDVSSEVGVTPNRVPWSFVSKAGGPVHSECDAISKAVSRDSRSSPGNRGRPKTAGAAAKLPEAP